MFRIYIYIYIYITYSYHIIVVLYMINLATADTNSSERRSIISYHIISYHIRDLSAVKIVDHLRTPYYCTALPNTYLFSNIETGGIVLIVATYPPIYRPFYFFIHHPSIHPSIHLPINTIVSSAQKK